MKRTGKIIAVSVAVIVAIIVISALVYILIQPLIYRDYYSKAEKEFEIAGLGDGVVPQGFAYAEDEEVYLQTGYMADGTSASRIYIIENDGSTRYIELFTADGSPYLGHTGGIAVGEELVWLANDGDEEQNDNCVWVLNSDLLLDEATTEITLTEYFLPESNSAYCTVYDGMLWVGEFYKDGEYSTKESHHLTTSTGEENSSLICGYIIDESKPNGLADETPDKILSVCEQIQGVAFNGNGEIALSSSYGFSSSHLYLHRNVLGDEADTAFTVDDTSVPVWFLDSDSLTEDLKTPPMSEELIAKDGKLYIMYESASNKYIFGNFIRGRYVYSYPL